MPASEPPFLGLSVIATTHIPEGLAHAMSHALGHMPTAGQLQAMHTIERLMDTDVFKPALVLTGYAGTGKTSLIGALVKVLRASGVPVVLLAPTGRAAKVLAQHAGLAASTIHRRIYRVQTRAGGGTGLALAPNMDRGALFIVDEASMIGEGLGDGPFGSRDLLDDLFTHVFAAGDTRLLLLGDPAQLPPVGLPDGPALDVLKLRKRGLNAGRVQLTEVVRQALGSGILSNATAIRAQLEKESPMPSFSVDLPDVDRVEGLDLQDALETAYAKYGTEEVCVITRSNKRAYAYGMEVRTRILGYEEELNGGDRLMVVKNDYFWAGQNGEEDLIANGELMEVLRVKDMEERYGMRFRWVEAAWGSGKERREGDLLVMLDVIALDAPALPYARRRMLVDAIKAEMGPLSEREKQRRLKQDPYANALQVKYAYAVTCHKAQGGQWRGVFVDQGYVTEDMIDAEYIRWLYTAVTRASEHLWLLNFHPKFYGEG